MELFYYSSSAAVIAFVVTFFSIPSIIKVAEQKHLYDEPDDSRKLHCSKIPTLGGIGIFGGMIISATLFVNFVQVPELAHTLPAFLLLFFTGVKDDIIPLSPRKKLVAQILAAAIVVGLAGIRFTNLYGLFWINDLPDWAGILVSIFTILVIVNAFNLIDGINGLAGGIGLICAVVFAYLFYTLGKPNFTVLSMSLAGALLAFLYYNLRAKAKIFMGDTGSLIIGLAVALFCIRFIEVNRMDSDKLFKATFAPILCFSILIIPLFDTLRVFVIRIAHGTSPFKGDRRHLHHILLDMGFNHWQSSLVLYFANLFFIVFTLLFQNISQIYAVLAILGLALTLTQVMVFFRNQRKTAKSPNPKVVPITHKAPQVLEREFASK
ncbi:MAG: undecaprenyl/decaprenyl-phosphate alpha-N-acetylglucosaminyl 1-phosphate transferase [Microscillaceae bacterium]|jgi:UDP-N-acetylmuramyl pentapeptide phosphotransferase/UDP-N-acetylglucosamine-1-phosphate transferase|nr:undecaprenyl/decaprenyl-phosphate alpha-N-acetylglucosaminyl 1-phosphate transferase [Microscillaceae bacterium]